MRGLNWNNLAIFTCLVCHIVTAAPSLRVKRSDELSEASDLNPINFEDDANGLTLDREKRKLPEAVFGTKNAVLGLVFGASNKGTRALVYPSSGSFGFGGSGVTAAPIKTTTDDTPDFDRAKVSLDIPDKLFNSSFQMVTNISKIIGELMMNSARRYSQFVDIFRPLLGKALTIKGIYVKQPVAKNVEINKV